MKLYSPDVRKKKQINGTVFPCVQGKNKQIKLYSPGCMDNNKLLKLYSPECMENNKHMKLYSPV
jgi:hypothetical protein